VARAAVSAFGRIDILVNNAGRGLLGAVEESSPDEVEAVFQTNVFGLLAVTRRRHHGTASRPGRGPQSRPGERPGQGRGDELSQWRGLAVSTRYDDPA
jgi:NAD(P)-dependent dehydrogenase (short-subunit alcohol dehydrogenase family)